MSTLKSLRERLQDRIDDAALRSAPRLALLAFAVAVGVFTALLSLPAATASGQRAPLIDSFFTAVSAVCVTGLATVNTGEYWSGFGQAVILLGVKVGGLGIMTLASLLGLAVSRRLGLTGRMLAAGESRASGLGDVRHLLRTIVVLATATELVIALALFPRLLNHHDNAGTAAWHSIFYSVSAFNNAGFSPDAEGLAPFADDPWFRGLLALAIFIGALGFPVYLNLVRSWRKPRDWSLTTKLTLTMIGLITVVSAALFATFEWNNPQTLGAKSPESRIFETLFVGVNQRSGGFAVLDHGAMHEHTRLLEEVTMFIGGGSGGTAGGIRVTTLAVLLLAIAAEARGRRDIEAFGKRIGTEALRAAVAVTMISLAIVIVGTMVVQSQTSDTVLPYGPSDQVGLPGSAVLYEVVSAYATTGLSTGITPYLPTDAKFTIAVVMFLGRVGSMTIAAALALSRQTRVIRYPSERPIIG